MLECKCISDAFNEGFTTELIDTCWNVNKNACRELAVECPELIDTCWNVNVIEFVIT